MKNALIFGVTGQDGSYLADHLLKYGYSVIGTYRKSSVDNAIRIKQHLTNPRFKLVSCDITDANRVNKILYDYSYVDYIFNEADQDHVGYSMENSSVSYDVTLKGAVNILSAVSRHLPLEHVKVFQPLSITMYDVPKVPHMIDIDYQWNPKTPYAIAKCAVANVCKAYAADGMKIYGGVMTSHDSPRRGSNYFLQRICRSAVDAANHFGEGRLEVRSPKDFLDIGHARDYMAYVIQYMETQQPGMFMLGTGVPTNVAVLVDEIYKNVNLDCRDYVKLVNNQDTAESFQVAYMDDDPLKWKFILPLETAKEIITNMVKTTPFKFLP